MYKLDLAGNFCTTFSISTKLSSETIPCMAGTLTGRSLSLDSGLSVAGEVEGSGRDSTVLPARTDLPTRGDCLGLRDANREARPTIFLAELSMTREVLTGDVATGVDVTPAAGEDSSRIKTKI